MKDNRRQGSGFMKLLRRSREDNKNSINDGVNELEKTSRHRRNRSITSRLKPIVSGNLPTVKKKRSSSVEYGQFLDETVRVNDEFRKKIIEGAKEKNEEVEKRESKQKLLGSIMTYLKHSSDVLDELIKLCGLFDKLEGVYSLIEAADTKFISSSLTKNPQSLNDRLQYIKWQKVFLDEWKSVTVEYPTVPKTGTKESGERVELLEKQLAEAEIIPTAATMKSTKYANSDDIEDNPLTMERLKSEPDISRLGELNSIFVLDVGEGGDRNVYEDCMDELFNHLPRYIKHPDFEAFEKNKQHQFKDYNAYEFYFLQQILPPLTLLCTLLVAILENGHNVLNDGLTKAKIVAQMGKEVKIKNTIDELTTKLRTLRTTLANSVFSSLRKPPIDIVTLLKDLSGNLDDVASIKEAVVSIEKNVDDKFMLGLVQISNYARVISDPGLLSGINSAIAHNHPSGGDQQSLSAANEMSLAISSVMEDSKELLGKIAVSFETKTIADSENANSCLFYNAHRDIVKRFNRVESTGRLNGWRPSSIGGGEKLMVSPVSMRKELATYKENSLMWDQSCSSEDLALLTPREGNSPRRKDSVVCETDREAVRDTLSRAARKLNGSKVSLFSKSETSEKNGKKANNNNRRKSINWDRLFSNK